MLLPPITSNFQSIETSVPSNSLWVGNLSDDVTDADLAALFNKHGALDIVKKNLLRSYAFVYFECVENAKAAREALQGTVLRGSALKIEFAKPAKQCKSLWVGGIGPSVTKEEIEEQFLRFGKMQEFKFLRDRNTAFVDYLRIEDATEALKNLNGLRIGGDQIRVDYLRSHPTRREQLPDFCDSREGQFLNRSMGIPDLPWIPHDFLRNYSDPAHYGPKRPQSSGDPKADGQPSNVLRVSYPPSSLMDEQMLHNAMILFGEIERIRSDPVRNSLFVEFRSVEEARRAKEGLEGRLFSDPRILIMYSNNELEPRKDQSGFYSGIKGPNMFLNDIPFRPGQMDIFSQNHLVPDSFPEHPLPRGVSGPDMLRNPLGLQGSFEPLLQGPEFSDLAKLHNLQDSNPNIVMGGPNRKRLSPAPGVFSSALPAMKPSNRTVSGSWDVFDASQLQRESKRSRTGSLLATLDPSLEKLDVRGSGFNQYHAHGLQVGGISGAPTNVQGMNRFSPVDARAVSGGTGQGHPELDYIWRGVIAKGGTHVCRARCVLVEKEFGFEIPEVVNCSARTGLDMLSKHLGDAAGFNIIYFLPNSVEDFAPYTEFLRYLGAKNRAGVAKFDDGTTLFLVPPSDFLIKVLNIAGPERLYGVVLKFPQHVPGTTSELPQLAQQHYIVRSMMPPRTENIIMPQDERILQTDYNRALHKNVYPSSMSLGPSTSNSFSEHAVQPISTAATSQTGITLTPELIATLASLLPTKLNSSGAQIDSGSSKPRPTLPPAATEGVYSHEWNHEQSKVPEQGGHRLNQAVHQDNSQSQFPSQLHYSVVSNTHGDSAQGVLGNTQIDGSTFNMIQHHGNPFTRTQSEQFPGSPQVNQQYQLETLQDTRPGYDQGTNALGLYTASLLQPTTISATLSDQVHGTTVSQRHNGVPIAGENIGLEPLNQVQQRHSTHSGPGQGTSEVEVDKKERYQSTLQFAANLLLQIQQQQHQHPGAEAAQGSDNH